MIDLSERIRQLMPTFSKGQKRIANAILDDYGTAAYMTASRLGAAAGVSESTVVRFANELGFSGYPEFQHAVQELMRTKLTPNQRIEITDQRIGDGDLLTKVMTADMDKIKYTIDNVSRTDFADSVDAILKARQIYVLGVRSSASLASFFYFNLNLIFDNLKLVQPTSTSEVFEQLFNIGPGDVLFAVSFPRYSTKIVTAVRYARSKGATVIGLTDSTLSPLAESANCLLTAQSDMASFVDSLVAPLSIINAILVAVTQNRKDEVKERFEQLEHIWDEYQVYEKR